ncbi:hypothetical protein Trydic_g12339 [Trypoxylus dichotomus]
MRVYSRDQSNVRCDGLAVVSFEFVFWSSNRSLLEVIYAMGSRTITSHTLLQAASSAYPIRLKTVNNDSVSGKASQSAIIGDAAPYNSGRFARQEATVRRKCFENRSRPSGKH